MRLFESEDERLLNKAVTVLKALKKGVLKIDVQKKDSHALAFFTIEYELFLRDDIPNPIVVDVVGNSIIPRLRVAEIKIRLPLENDNIEDFMDEYENKYEELCNNIHRALNRKFSVFRVAISIMNSSKHPVSLVQ